MPDDEERQEHQGLHSGRFAIIPAVALDDPRITPALLKLLCVLGTYGNRDGYCWPKRKTLAKRLGDISEPAVTQAIRKLAKFGYLEVESRFGANGVQLGNRYRILYDVLPDTPQTVTLGLAPEVTLPLAPEVTPLTSHYERPTLSGSSGISDDLVYPSAAASAHARTREGTAEAAAAENAKDAFAETAEAVRRLLRMDRSKLPGLRLIVAQYPDARAWLQNQANLCFESLKVRPLELKHFSNWLDECERRRSAAREETSHDESTTAAETPTQVAKARRDPDELTDDEREAIKAELNARVARLFGANTAG